jgi:hypothetical protein
MEETDDKLDKTFTATIERSDAPGGWTYMVTDWTAEALGIVAVSATCCSC